MEDSADPETRSETVIFNPLKLKRAEATSVIMREVEDCGLVVDRIDERPKRFSIDMRVTVTGRPDQIAAFYRSTGGRGEHEPEGIRIRHWLKAIWEGISGSGL